MDVEIDDEVGLIVEFWDEWKIIQFSYCYIARAIGQKRAVRFTNKEIEDGFELLWLSPEEAVRRFQDLNTEHYGGRHMQLRDGVFLQEALNILNKR